jgi:hypothetical protein
MSGNLHRFDYQFFTAQPLYIAAAADAMREYRVQIEFSAALAAAAAARRLHDFKLRAFREGAFGAKLEAKSNRVRQNARKFTDLQHNALDFPLLRAPRHDFQDFLREAKLMHE